MKRLLRKLLARSARKPREGSSVHPLWTSFHDHSHPYITGNGIASRCRHVWNYDGYRVNPDLRNNLVFVKTDYIDQFFAKVRLDEPFVLFTHNSDYPVDRSLIRHLDDPRVLLWFAQNADVRHPKLRSIPIGIANAGYSHGDIDVIDRVRGERHDRSQLFYANFNVDNNRMEREYCLQQTRLRLRDEVDGGWNEFAGGYRLPTSFEGYLRDLRRTFFCISPKGNGIDCHRTWEALYMGCIPIVTRSEVAEAHKDMPIVILDDWSQFKDREFTEALHRSIWGDFDVSELHLDNYWRRIDREIDRSTPRP
jgi:hypothetical protein